MGGYSEATGGWRSEFFIQQTSIEGLANIREEITQRGSRPVEETDTETDNSSKMW